MKAKLYQITVTGLNSSTQARLSVVFVTMAANSKDAKERVSNMYDMSDLTNLEWIIEEINNPVQVQGVY